MRNHIRRVCGISALCLAATHLCGNDVAQHLRQLHAALTKLKNSVKRQPSPKIARLRKGVEKLFISPAQQQQQQPTQQQQQPAQQKQKPAQQPTQQQQQPTQQQQQQGPSQPASQGQAAPTATQGQEDQDTSQQAAIPPPPTQEGGIPEPPSPPQNLSLLPKRKIPTAQEQGDGAADITSQAAPKQKPSQGEGGGALMQELLEKLPRGGQSAQPKDGQQPSATDQDGQQEQTTQAPRVQLKKPQPQRQKQGEPQWKKVLDEEISREQYPELYSVMDDQVLGEIHKNEGPSSDWFISQVLRPFLRQVTQYEKMQRYIIDNPGTIKGLLEPLWQAEKWDLMKKTTYKNLTDPQKYPNSS